MNNRIREIKNLIQEDPMDPFLYYALALEYLKNNQDNLANELFDELLTKFPDYLPAYYHAAHFYWKQQDLEKARSVFVKGLELAEEQGDIKTLNELQSSHTNLLIELED